MSVSPFRGVYKIHLVGQTVGRYQVLAETDTAQNGSRMFRCRCSCGNERVVAFGNLRRGRSRSCGCLRRDTARLRKTHGQSRPGNQWHREYVSWMGMRRRCYKRSHHAFPRYGGRGITVCEQWRDSFAQFLSDMGPRPTSAHELDRIDNDAPYTPSNCRWVTCTVQANNRGAFNRTLTHNGHTHTLGEWATLTGNSYYTMYTRMTHNWPVSAVLSDQKFHRYNRPFMP